MKKNPTLLVVAAALTNPHGRILLQQRAPGRAMAGLWEFPGGKVEPGETPEAALVRELREELGIETEESCLSPVCFASAPHGPAHLLLLLYACREWRGEVRAIDATALQWARPSEMHALAMPPADLPLIGLLEAYLTSINRASG